MNIDYEEVESRFEYKFGDLVSLMHFRLLEMCEGRLVYNRARDSRDFMEFIKETSTAYFDVVDQMAEEEKSEDNEENDYSED